jgi:predicted transcriptional regulator
MSNTNTKSNPLLTETIAVRLSNDECRALAAIAERSDRTISYVVRAQLRNFLLNQQRSV